MIMMKKKLVVLKVGLLLNFYKLLQHETKCMNKNSFNLQKKELPSIQHSVCYIVRSKFLCFAWNNKYEDVLHVLSTYSECISSLVISCSVF